MKRFTFGLITIVLVLVLTVPVKAQNETPKTKFMVWEVEYAPAQFAKLQDAIKTEHSFFAEHDYSVPAYVQHTEEGILYYSVPFTSYTELDGIFSKVNKLFEGHEDEAKAINDKYNVSYSKVGRMIIEYQPELSNSTDTENSADFRAFEKFYINPGKEAKFKELFTQYKKLINEKGVAYTYGVYFPEFADDLSVVYYLSQEGTSAADYYTKSDAKWAALGEEGGKLFQLFSEVVYKVETQLGQFDADLSYMPEN